VSDAVTLTQAFWTFDPKTAKAKRLPIDTDVEEVFASPAGMLGIRDTDLPRH
jgi:hypothetical protein